MTNSKMRLLAGSAAALAICCAQPAYAEGTTAGSTITNTVTVGFKVNNVDQTTVQAQNQFTVDRKVQVLVQELGNSTTQVAPNQTAAVTTFQVANLSNTTVDIGLAATQLTTGTAGAHSNNDSFDATNVRIYRDTNGSGSYDAGDDQITYLDEALAQPASGTTYATVFVVVDIPANAANAGVAAVRLTGTAREGGTASSQGAVISATTGANTAGVDTVLVNNGTSSALDDYTVASANLTINKYSRIISDPVNGTTNPKYVPGAVVEYCIVVANGSGAQTATDILVTDPLPSELTYLSAFGVFQGGSYDSGTQVCSGGTNNGAFAAGTVTGTIASVAAGAASTVYFRATIN